jgi:SecD/SecF fusion protein
MKTSLAWRFLVILLIIAGAGWIVKNKPLLLGIDLAGGTQLIYELDTAKIQDTGGHRSTGELANRLIETLKKRVDPNGVKNLIWRVVGDKRIEVQMPLADKATRDARKELNDAMDALQGTAVNSGQLLRVLELKGPEREAAINETTKIPEARTLINDLASANDALVAANAKRAEAERAGGLAGVPLEILEAQNKARIKYTEAKAKLDAINVDVNALKTLLIAADDQKNAAAQTQLATFPSKYPSQKPAIERVITAHKNLIARSGGGVEDPADLQRMITSAGVLDFRITVDPSDLPGEAYTAAMQRLERDGPQVSETAGGLKARWFEIDHKSRENFIKGGYITGKWAGQEYVLCYDDPSRSLTHLPPPAPAWSVTASDPYMSPQDGKWLLPFNLDPIGANMMGDLTANNIKRPMAILLDNKAISAPVIQSRISNAGTISFGGGNAQRDLKEAQELQQILDAGSLPATLQKDPISIVEITPDLGKDNIEAGLRSGIYALIAVVFFMMLYYTITGAFANIALAINLLLVLAGMIALKGTLTLPGIAGLVLTLGMAVDANVLINERIREEIHRGASLWMAVKQGYDKVFWTIFDANLTTSLTAIILYYFGSEEVKGFGLTLFIGLTIHMFTALFVTRTLMMAAIKYGILRQIDDHSLAQYIREIFTLTWLRQGRWPFMRVITVSNIDWISKRHWFWAVSAIITIAGIAAFFARGEDKYDIEFRGGTKVTFQMKPDANGKYLDLEGFRSRINAIADSDKYRATLGELRSARIYASGGESAHRFEMETTIANPADNSSYVKNTLLQPLADELKDVLDTTQKVSISNASPTEGTQSLTVAEMIERGTIRPIETGTLDKVFEDTPVKNIPSRDVSEQLHGVAILLENMNPPQTAKQLSERIITARQLQEFNTVPNRNARVIPLVALENGKEVAAADNDQRPLVRAVIVSKDESAPYVEGPEWQQKVAGTEWQIVQAALSTESLFKGVTSFDAAVAGQAKTAALLAVALSLMLIVIYVWIRFGGIRYGIGAILALVHDATVALAATVLSGWVFHYVFGGKSNFLLLSDFKINLTMVAAYLTIIGYSVNDTIVIFDRVRELRGKSNAPLTPKLINDAINQCFGRTIWTTFTVLIVVLIMYIWGGSGIRGFAFAMLCGIITGVYSTLAIASPMLLATGAASEKNTPPGPTLERRNPFLNAKVEPTAP